MTAGPPVGVEFVYRLARDREWRQARREGVYRGGEADRRDGFVHLSTAGQVAETAARYYPGSRDLVLLQIPLTGLAGLDLRWEPSRGGARFPHLYGALPVAAVARAARVPLGAAGAHVFGDLA